MKSKYVSLTVLAIVVLILSACISAQTRTVVTVASVPQIPNSGAEDGFYLFQNIGELEVPNSWEPWFYEGGSDSYHRPEYKPETLNTGSSRVHTGMYAAKMFTTFSMHKAGLKTCIGGMTPGQRYVFSGWSYTWASPNDNPDESAPQAGYMTALGVNPWGGNIKDKHGDTQMVWGKGTFDYNVWVYHTVEFTAWSSNVCLYTLGETKWPIKHNDSYWDDFGLEAMSSQEPCDTPTPQPTYTLYPTQTPFPTYTPQPTVPPNGSPTPTPVGFEELDCNYIAGAFGQAYYICEYMGDRWYKDADTNENFCVNR